MDIELTKDSELLLCILYGKYVSLTSAGVPKTRAKCFGSSIEIQRDLIPEWTFPNTDETCRELSRAGMISVFYADNIAYSVSLSDKGIIYMENRFNKKVSEILDRIEQLKNIIF